jgi:dTMP kinase
MAKKTLKTLRHFDKLSVVLSKVEGRQAQGLYPERSRRIKRGIFITFEGGEGSGKTTHSRLLYEYLRRRSHDCIYTREPGGTKLGELIRSVLLKSDGVDICDLTELFLFEASRSQLVEEVISPALAQKKIVICDRFNDATYSYQGYGGKVPIATIRALDNVSRGKLRPDLTILLDIDTTTGLRRAGKKGSDRMETKDLAYHKRVRKGYLKLAKKEPRRIKVIKVAGGIDETQALVRREAELVIQRYKRTG